MLLKKFPYGDFHTIFHFLNGVKGEAPSPSPKKAIKNTKIGDLLEFSKSRSCFWCTWLSKTTVTWRPHEHLVPPFWTVPLLVLLDFLLSRNEWVRSSVQESWEQWSSPYLQQLLCLRPFLFGNQDFETGLAKAAPKSAERRLVNNNNNRYLRFINPLLWKHN